MKNLKKVLALTLALAMVISTMTTAFASTNDEKAKVLYKLGLFKGTSTTEYVPALNEDADAAQALVLIGRALKWDVDMNATVEFKDVPAWAAPYVAYAVDKGITNGVSTTEFGVKVINGQRVVAWFLRALGYDSTEAWEDTATLAATAGLTIPATSNRDAIVGVIYDGLMTTPVGGEKSLIASIVGDDEAMTDIAVAAGLMDETPDTLEVTSVKAPNLRQIFVTFNKSVEDLEYDEKDNYELDDDADVEINAKTDFDLSKDGKVVTITLEKAAEQQKEAVLTIDKDLLGSDTDFDFQFLDTDIPTVDDAETVGNDTIKVFFSEPMALATLTDSDNYTVEDKDGDEFNVKSVTAQKNNTEALVEIYSNLEDDVTIEVNGVKDENGFKALKKKLNVPVSVDETAPKVVSYEAKSLTKVVLTFDEDIEINDDDQDLYYHTNDKNTVTSVSVDGDELTLTFTDHELPDGPAVLTIEEDAINDLWDNNNDKMRIELDVEADETAPVVDGDVELDGQKVIQVPFDEEISIDGDDFEVILYDKHGDESDIDSTKEQVIDADDDDDDNSVLEITFDDELYGDYTVKIIDIEDLAENSATVKVDFTADDETDPVATDFTAVLYLGEKDKDGNRDQLIKIDFDEEMDKNDISDLKEYFVKGKSLDDDDVDIDVVDDGEAVEITVPSDFLEIKAGDSVVIGRIKDAAGNLLASPTAVVEIKESGSVELDSVELIDDETIVITLKEKELKNFDQDKITFYAGTETNKLGVKRFKTGKNDDGDATITAELTGYIVDADGKDVGDKVGINTDATVGTSRAAIGYKIAAGAGENDYGEYITTNSAVKFADKAAPEVVEDGIKYVSNEIITIEFTEDLDPATFSTKGSNGFDVSGGDAELLNVTVSGNVVTLHADIDVKDNNNGEFTKDTNVAYDDAYGITDLNDNDLEAFTHNDRLK